MGLALLIRGRVAALSTRDKSLHVFSIHYSLPLNDGNQRVTAIGVPEEVTSQRYKVNRGTD